MIRYDMILKPFVIVQILLAMNILFMTGHLLSSCPQETEILFLNAYTKYINYNLSNF